MPRLLFLFPLLLPACASSWNPTWYSQPDSATPLLDQDQDGYAADEDCDDNDAAIHPGAEEEPYDGLDNDCDEARPYDDLVKSARRWSSTATTAMPASIPAPRSVATAWTTTATA